jgi:hypothetical protein
MANSQNGWPVDPTGAKQDRAPLIRNITVPNGVRAGDVAVVFRWLAREYDRRVEKLIPGWCWGWFVKKIEGSSVVSNHASGTAVDFNAPDNPMGSGTTRRSMTQRQIDACHAIERESGGVLRWGGDFSRNDPMHWEIVGSQAETKRFADEIRADLARDEEDEVTPQEIERIADRVVEKLTTMTPFPTGGGSGSPVGAAVWAHGYPQDPGGATAENPRRQAYNNLQDLAADVTEIKTKLNEGTA